MSHTNEQIKHEPDTETIVECAGCERRFLEGNAHVDTLDELGKRCPLCGTPLSQSDGTQVLVGERQTLRFAGGVRADIRLSGDEDLLPHVRRELRRAVDNWRARFEGSDGRGGTITSEHQRRCLDEYPDPLGVLASDLIALNETKFLEDGAMADTYGADQIREQGLTTNQRTWLETIAELLADREAWACDECGEHPTTATKGGTALCNECIFEGGDT